MVSIVTEKLSKELYFVCLMSDNVIENPLASIGVRDTAFKVLRPIIRQTARKAVDIMTEVVQKREISDDVNSFFLVAYTVLGEGIYRLIMLKISDQISEDDGLFMFQNYTSVSRLRMVDFKAVFNNFSKKSASTATHDDGQNITASSSSTLTNQRSGWLSRFFNFPVIRALLFLLKVLSINPNSHMGSNLLSPGGNYGIMTRDERLCDLVPQIHETKSMLTRSVSVHETDETPDVAISYSVEPYGGDWYTELLARDTPLDTSILEFADIDDLFPDDDDSTEAANTSGSFPEKPASTPSSDPHTSKPSDNEQATVMPSTADKVLLDKLSKRQGTTMGSLFANVPDLFSTNELRPAFDEDTTRATAVATPEESDSTNGLGDFDFPSMYEYDWKETIGFSRAPVEQSNSTRLYPINLPDGTLENLENENSQQQ